MLDYLSVALTTQFSKCFFRNVLCCKVILVFCLILVFTIELTLKENSDRTEELRRKIV